jgi:hypothetical protein
MTAELLDIGLQCSHHELFTLAALLGGETLIGVPDPFPGWLTEEIRDAMRQAQEQLIERNVLRVVDSDIRMDAFVALLVGTLIEPQAVLLANLSQARGEIQQKTFYARSPFSIELTRTSEDNYHLHLLADGEQVHSLILGFWGVDAKVPPAKSPAFSLPQRILEQLRHTSEQVKNMLKPYGTGGEIFLRSLRSAQRNGAVVAMRKRATWQVGGMGFLQAENGLWRLRSFHQSGENWVEVIPCDLSSLQAELHVLLASFWLQD